MPLKSDEEGTDCGHIYKKTTQQQPTVEVSQAALGGIIFQVSVSEFPAKNNYSDFISYEHRFRDCAI